MSPKKDEPVSLISSGFTDRMKKYIASSFPAILVQTAEYERCLPELHALARTLKVEPLEWNILDGFTEDGRPINEETADPLKALTHILRKQVKEKTMILFKDFHHHLPGVEIIEAIRQLVELCKATNRYLIFLSPVPDIPRELEKLIVLVEHDLPTKDELELIFRESLPYAKSHIDSLSRDEVSQILDAARGLTAFEAENAFALSFGTKKKMDVGVIQEQKRQVLAKSQILEYCEREFSLDDIGGLDILKEWLLERRAGFSEEARKYGLPKPKGVLTLGIPGSGKSLTAKATATVLEVPLLRLDVGRVFAGLVGASEANMRSALRVAEACAPCVLWVDEIEKSFAGVASSGSTDSGVTARVVGSFLTWMQEKKSDVFVYATANDISKLPPELLRKGRFDELFFVDLPNDEERKEIVVIHLKRRGRDPKKFDIDGIVEKANGMTGAEIEAGIIAAMYRAFGTKKEVTDFHIMKAFMDTVPLSKQMAEQINAMRTWAQNRAVFATSQEERGGERGRKSLD